jgi:hypothetical protein
MTSLMPIQQALEIFLMMMMMQLLVVKKRTSMLV